MFLTHRQLLRSLDTSRVEAAIGQAERATSGEIRVSVSRLFWGDVRRNAERAFDRLGMTATAERNGILFFVVPARRKFVVLGDAGIHARVGPDFWEHVTAAVASRFRSGDFTDGLVHGIETVGRELAVHFPAAGLRDVNELPDAVDFGG